MRQSSLDFKKDQETPDRDHQFRTKGQHIRKPKVLKNELKDDSLEILSESSPEKKGTKKGGRAQAKRNAKSSNSKNK
jgi:hypothetical protein